MCCEGSIILYNTPGESPLKEKTRNDTNNRCPKGALPSGGIPEEFLRNSWNRYSKGIHRKEFLRNS
jgi:hypothetical protein